MRFEQMRLAVVIAALFGSWGVSAYAADCRVGSLRGTKSPNGPPDDNIQCKVLGRIFCSLEDYRISDIPQEPAVERTADWLSHLGQTGSHLSGDYRPAVRTAAAYVYSHDKMPPWTAYNYAVYTCGVNMRITDPAARQKIADPWENAAQECRKQFPGEGDGAGNEKLKRCLERAMNSLVKDTQIVKK